jgi:hypothetical protein
MPDDTSRYGRDRLNPFEFHLAESADKLAFTFRPWKLGGLRLTDEQLVSHVEEELAEHGFWTDYGEMAMGAGMQARIDLVETDGAAAYREPRLVHSFALAEIPSTSTTESLDLCSLALIMGCLAGEAGSLFGMFCSHRRSHHW